MTREFAGGEFATKSFMCACRTCSIAITPKCLGFPRRRSISSPGLRLISRQGRLLMFARSAVARHFDPKAFIEGRADTHSAGFELGQQPRSAVGLLVAHPARQMA